MTALLSFGLIALFTGLIVLERFIDRQRYDSRELKRSRYDE